MRKKKTIHGQGRLCEYFWQTLSATTRTWLSVCLSASMSCPILPPPAPSCLVLSPRIDFQFLWRSFYIIYWVGNFFVGLLSLFSAHTVLDNAVWIGQKLNSFAYMRIIYFVDSFPPPPYDFHRGTSWSKKVKSEKRNQNWKTESSAACLMAEAANQPRTHL